MRTKLIRRILFAFMVAGISACASDSTDSPTTETPGVTLPPAAKVIVQPTTGLSTSENGITATFSVVLSTKPSENVTILLESSVATEGRVTIPASQQLTFTADNFDLAQDVTVTGLADNVVDGDQEYMIRLTLTSNDALYANIDPDDVTLINIDTDTTTLPPQPIYSVEYVFPNSGAGLVTTESGGTATFDVKLTAQPQANTSVTINFKSLNAEEGLVTSGNSLSFNSDNWGVSQVVEITGQADNTFDNDQSYVIESTLTSTDSNYQNLNPDDIQVINQNVDAPAPGVAAILLSPSSGLITTEAGAGEASFDVKLSTTPTADVVLNFSSDNTNEGIVTSASKQITLTANNFNSPRNTVTIQGQEDNTIDGDQNYAVNFTITTADSSYSALSPSPISVTNIDSKITDAMININPSPSGNNVTTELGDAVTFSVVLSKQPTADVVMVIASDTPTEGVVEQTNTATLTFTSSTWNTPQSFTVTGQADTVVDGDQSYTVALNITSNDANYQPGNNASLPTSIGLTNIDNTPPPQTTDYRLYINTGTVNIYSPEDPTLVVDTIPVWGYTDTIDGLPDSAQVPGPLLEAIVGGTITVEVINNHDVPHNFVVTGLAQDATEILPGESKIYTLNTDTAGVFLYGDSLAPLNRAMGMFGALIVRDTTNPVASFNFEKLWVITDMDKKQWNDLASVGSPVIEPYNPDYFLMNGMNGFKAMHDPATVLSGVVGETFIVRIVNAGMYDQSLHFHGNHFSVISQDGNKLPSVIEQDTINVKAGRTAVVLYTINKTGAYPMHVHTAQMETGNDGVYLQGTATMIIGQ